MNKSRLEAFSDGVLAIIITIMVLELHVPHGTELAALRPLAPVFGSYVLSFVYVGIYWNNHHHMLHATKLRPWRLPSAVTGKGRRPSCSISRPSFSPSSARGLRTGCMSSWR
jgi:hypothetical protein